ncbi:branched-chain amino acid transaminase [Maricaulaceae bacterium EIL42A08]|nr:branched-chain amino acid transaminase [Maricaulaceae bacterium EIL42A08]
MAIMPDFDDRDGFIHLDGKLIPWREARTHLLSHALHYSTAVFEGERAYGGKIFKCREHSERLIRSAQAIFLPLNVTAEEIDNAKYETLEANGFETAYVRAFAFLGSKKMGVDPSQAGPAHFAVAVWTDWDSYVDPDTLAKGVDLATVPTRRPPPECIRVQAKAAGNYQISICAKSEAQALGAYDALMLDWEGNVAESSGSNIFYVKGNTLHTPNADRFLNGITRQTVIKLCRDHGLEVDDTRRISPEELLDADEIFLTGSAFEVTPVARIKHEGKTHEFSARERSLWVADQYAKTVRGG